jgi:hypothetical protein
MTSSRTVELLERATADLRPSTDLVAGGVTTGRRRQRRGRALIAAGTLAAAAVGGTALNLPGSGPDGDRTEVTDPSASTGASYAVQPSPTAAPQVFPASGPFPLPPEAMASTLATLLDGTVTHPTFDQYHHAAPDGWQSGAVDLDGASVSVAYQHSTGPRCGGDLARGNTTCVALGDGYFLGTHSAEITTVAQGKTGVRDLGVTYYTPDGYKISVTATNASSTDPTRPTMDQPVLDLDALTAIAEDLVWR